VTYSIVARDSASGQLGVAVQTAMFAVGSVVPWARAGVGAVATQAITEISYGPRGLDAMASGADAATALAGAMAADPMTALRQVAMVDADGRTAVTTGDLCIDDAGHQQGDGYSVQANMMASPTVWPAMAEAYEATTGALASRLLAALDAGEAAGGDARGRMAAALIVVEADRAADPQLDDWSTCGSTTTPSRWSNCAGWSGWPTRSAASAGPSTSRWPVTAPPPWPSSNRRWPCSPTTRTCGSSTPVPGSPPARSTRPRPSCGPSCVTAHHGRPRAQLRGQGTHAPPPGTTVDDLLGSLRQTGGNSPRKPGV